MKLTIRILFFLFAFNLFAKTSVIGEYKIFAVVSKNKHTNYYLVEPAKKIKLKLSDYSILYIRGLVKRSVPSYYFKIISNGYEKTYKRKIKISKSVSGAKGEKLTVLYKIMPKINYIVFKNISDIPILIRIKEKYKDIDFVPISPNDYEKVINFTIKDKTYPYYQGNGEISLDIKGEAILKIILRNTKAEDYYFSLFDNGRLVETEKIKYKKSKVASIKISKGKVKIYKISKGMHKIKIQTPKEVAIRLFINKKAVRLAK